MTPPRVCGNCKVTPATKRHRAGDFYYCDQCVWELGLRDVVGIGEMEGRR